MDRAYTDYGVAGVFVLLLGRNSGGNIGGKLGNRKGKTGRENPCFRKQGISYGAGKYGGVFS